MIAITTVTFDLAGVLLLNKVKQPAPEIMRRVSRTKTIDGGVVIQDSGLSHGDRTFVVTISDLSQEIVDRVFYLIQAYSEIHIATEEGFFLGSLERFFTKSTGEGRLTILVKDKLS